MQIRLAHAALCLLCAVGLPTAIGSAEAMTEVWRSPFGNPYSVAVNPGDGSCWAATGASVMHLSAQGDTLSQTDGFWWPGAVSVNPTDGTCWVADGGFSASVYGTVTHLASDGTRLAVRTDFFAPAALVVDPTDGSCWVADTGNARLVHLSATSDVLWQSGVLGYVYSVAVNPTDGSCWAGASGEVLHLDAAGTVLSRSAVYEYAPSVSVDPRDGSCWVAEVDLDAHFDYVIHLSSTGDVLWASPSEQFFGPDSVWVNPADGSCLVADTQHDEIVLLAADGRELWRRGGFSLPKSVCANPADDSIRVGDGGMHNQIVALHADGGEQWRRGGMSLPWSVSVDPSDGTCWVADNGNHRVVRLAENGAELLHLDLTAVSVSVNTADDSCWIGDLDGRQVVHVAADGAEKWRSGAYGALAICANPADNSCWVADQAPGPIAAGEVVHLSESGTELWRGGSFVAVVSLSVNPSDGSCWVADPQGDQVVHLSVEGDQLWRGEIVWPMDVSVNPTDGSCWVARGVCVLHLAADGTPLVEVPTSEWSPVVSVDPSDGSCWVGADIYMMHLASDGTALLTQPVGRGAGSIAVNRADGTCWVADRTHSQVIHFAPPGYRPPTFSDVPSASWAFWEIEVCFEAGIVGGYPNGTYGPRLPVTRDQTAVFIARALAGGDAYVPTGPATATFPDVPVGHWAFRHVEYAHSAGVVGGYWDGTYRPSLVLDRGQMAVFVARAMVGGDAYVPTGPATAYFPDVATDHWAFRYVEYIRGEGVTGGYPDGKYHPEYACTRDQVAVFVQRAFRLP